MFNIKINWYKILCFITLKSVHLRCKTDDHGITCIDCGYFKSKYEHIADLNAGGGW